MIRVTTIFLCLLLAAAAAGRYRAEESVRDIRNELRQLEKSKAEEGRSIQMLRAEVAYLENPERLSKIAAAKTDLRPSQTSQIFNADDFIAAFGGDEAAGDFAKPGIDGPVNGPVNSDVILHALAMADIQDVE